jgi:hypothetical protein
MKTHKLIEIRDIFFKTEAEVIRRLITRLVKDYEAGKKIDIIITIDPQMTTKWKWKKIYLEDDDVYLKLKEIAKENKVTITIIVDYLIREFLK